MSYSFSPKFLFVAFANIGPNEPGSGYVYGGVSMGHNNFKWGTHSGHIQ